MNADNQPRRPKGAPGAGEFTFGAAGEGSTLTLDAPETTFTARYDSVDEKIAAFGEELERAVEGLIDDEQWHHYLETMSRFHHYSMSNQLLIALQRPDATRVAGYGKWQELGRQVMKGEKGIQIFRPYLKSVPANEGELGAFFDKKTKMWRRRIVSGFGVTNVFDVAQTDGEPLPEGRREISTEPPAGFEDDLKSAIEAAGFKVTEVDNLGGARGSTDKDGNVKVLASLSPAEKAATLAHELGHIKAGHLDRLDEYHQGHDGHRSEMEVEAEAISYVLCRANGMDIEGAGHHDRYISGWGGVNGAADKLRDSADTVAKTVKTIISGGGWRNVETHEVPAS